MLPHDRPLAEVEFVAFDLETTGLFPVVNRIVEFGAVRFRLDGRELGTWEQLVDPECPIPPGVTEIHGITDTMVRGQPTVARALPGFLDFLGRTEAILLAHNATFDLGFLNFAAAKTGRRSLPTQSSTRWTWHAPAFAVRLVARIAAARSSAVNASLPVFNFVIVNSLFLTLRVRKCRRGAAG